MKDVTVTSPLTPALLTGAGMAVLQVLLLSCASTLPVIPSVRNWVGCVCSPRLRDLCSNWGREAHTTFTRLATRLAICASLPKSRVIADTQV